MRRLYLLIEDCLGCPYCNPNKCQRLKCDEPAVYTCDHPDGKLKYLETSGSSCMINIPDWCPLDVTDDNEKGIAPIVDIGHIEPRIMYDEKEE